MSEPIDATKTPAKRISTFVAMFRRHLRPENIPTHTARVYFEAILPDFKVLQQPSGPATSDDWTAANEILNKYLSDPDGMRLDQSLLFERLVLRLQPDVALEGLRRKVLTLRERYQTLVGPDEYRLYAEATPLPGVSATAASLKADAEDLISRFHRIYTVAPLREEARNAFSGAIVQRLVLWSVVVAVGYTSLFVIRQFLKYDAPIIATAAIAAIAGAVGGVISVQQRIQSAPSTGDPIRGVMALTHGWFSVFLSPAIGAVFAFLLYLLFVGKFLEGNLFPKVEGGNSTEIYPFLINSTPVAGEDFAKLIVWSFIAGFAERTVPDTLTRVAESVRTTQITPVPPKS